MIASEMVSKVALMIHDPSFSDTDILSELNQGLVVVAGGGDRPAPYPLLAPLPGLLTSSTVTATSAAGSVSMPATYQRGVTAVINSNGQRLRRYHSYHDFLDAWPKLETGSIEAYCVVGKTLHYAPSQDTTLTIHYHSTPATMGTGDEPDGLDPQFHSKILVSYACKELYAAIEDPMDSGSRNTDKWFGKYMMGLTDLERFIGPEDVGPEQITDVTDYI